MTYTPICHLDDRNYQKIAVLANTFSDFSLNQIRLLIEVKYLLHLSQVKIIRPFSVTEKKFLQKIVDDFDELQFTEVKKIETKTNHDIKALELYLRAKLKKSSLKDYESYVHICLSSEDINKLS